MDPLGKERYHAYTKCGLKVGAFCTEMCAASWSKYERGVRHGAKGQYEIAIDDSAWCAPPREAAPRFGGDMTTRKFRRFNSKGAAVSRSNWYKLGTDTSNWMKHNFYLGASGKAFATCRPATSEFCWWDGIFIPKDTARVSTCIMYMPAKKLVIKDRYRFAESVDIDFEGRDRDENFIRYGSFCSRECRAAWTAYTMERDLNLVGEAGRLDEAISVLHDEEPVVPTMLDRHALKHFGGFLEHRMFKQMSSHHECTVDAFSSNGYLLHKVCVMQPYSEELPELEPQEKEVSMMDIPDIE